MSNKIINNEERSVESSVVERSDLIRIPLSDIPFDTLLILFSYVKKSNLIPLRLVCRVFEIAFQKCLHSYPFLRVFQSLNKLFNQKRKKKKKKLGKSFEINWKLLKNFSNSTKRVVETGRCLSKLEKFVSSLRFANEGKRNLHEMMKKLVSIWTSTYDDLEDGEHYYIQESIVRFEKLLKIKYDVKYVVFRNKPLYDSMKYCDDSDDEERNNSPRKFTLETFIEFTDLRNPKNCPRYGIYFKDNFFKKPSYVRKMEHKEKYDYDFQESTYQYGEEKTKDWRYSIEGSKKEEMEKKVDVVDDMDEVMFEHVITSVMDILGVRKNYFKMTFLKRLFLKHLHFLKRPVTELEEYEEYKYMIEEQERDFLENNQ